MSVSNFEELSVHVGHDIHCVHYTNEDGPVNVALECWDCNEVLLDFDKDESHWGYGDGDDSGEDIVNHPSHYCDGGIETIDYITLIKAPFDIGNAIKYISRAGKKDKNNAFVDIKKARFYVNHYIEHMSLRNSYVIEDGLDFRPANIRISDFIAAKNITDNNLVAALNLIDRAFNVPVIGNGLIHLLNSVRNALDKYIEEHEVAA